MSDKHLITHSRLSLANRCLRAHYYRYELGIERENTGGPLRIGSAFHEALDYMAQGGDVEGAVAKVQANYSELPRWVMTPDDQREWECEASMVCAMVEAYAWRWQDAAIEIMATEMSFEMSLRNPDTRWGSTSHRLAGKIDKIVKLPDGRIALMEHKTTSDDIEEGSDYWARLRLDSQISIYMLAAKRLGWDVQTVLYDVIRKPLIRPWKRSAEIKLTKAGKPYANQRENDETPEGFGQRCKDAMMNDHSRYFHRQEIPRLERDLELTTVELWQQHERLKQARRSHAWYRNTQACLVPYRCPFLELCSNDIDPTKELPAGFVRLDKVHNELEGAIT